MFTQSRLEETCLGGLPANKSRLLCWTPTQQQAVILSIPRMSIPRGHPGIQAENRRAFSDAGLLSGESGTRQSSPPKLGSILNFKDSPRRPFGLPQKTL